LFDGETASFSGIPGDVGGETRRRVLRTRDAGEFLATVSIGAIVRAGAPVGTVGAHTVRTRIDGRVRGLIADGAVVRVGQKVGDIDPRGESVRCDTLSDKADAVGRGALEAALVLLDSVSSQRPI